MKTSREGIMQCEGWRRTGGAFTLGPPVWKQCENEPVVTLTVIQDGKTEEMPSCQKCWIEGRKNKIEILAAVPLETSEGNDEVTRRTKVDNAFCPNCGMEWLEEVDLLYGGEYTNGLHLQCIECGGTIGPGNYELPTESE